MQLKDATSRFGGLGLLIPLILIFLTADSAFACPGNKTGAAYRTRAINTRTVSLMKPTVISYRAPASYQRCGANMYDTRGARYVAMRGSGAKYVAVRNGDGFGKLRRDRYIAVRNVDLDDEPRYVAVRSRHPVYRISDSRYAEIRSGYRSGNGIVRYIDVDDDEPRYIAVRRVPAVRYVAVQSNAPRVRYIAVRNIDPGCPRAVALRSCLDEVETTSVKPVALQNDNGYSADTKDVVLQDESDDDASMLQNESDDDEAYAAVPTDTTKYVEYRDASYLNDDDETPVAVSTRAISYVPVSDDDDDQALLDGDGSTYVAAGDIEDACLNRVAIGVAPVAPSTRAVSYVPVEDVDDDASLVGSEPAYIAAENAAPAMRYVALDDADDSIDADTTYVAADDVDDVDTGPVSYVPVEDIEDADAGTVRYVPVDNNVDDVEDADGVTYVPVESVDAETVSYVPVEAVDDVDTTDIAAHECPMSVSSVDAEPYSVADASTVTVEEVDSDLVADLHGTQQIAGKFGYRDGFEDGQEAALERDLYHPENSGDFEKATNGYEDTFGDKDVYKDGYRNSYLQGYRAGFEAVNGSA